MPQRAQLSREVLEAALSGLEAQRDRLVTQIAQVESMLKSTMPRRTQSPEAPTKTRRRRKMSAAGRKRIADAAKKRWAEWKKQRQLA